MSNGNGTATHSPEEIIKAMVEFMDHTNQMLIDLKIQLSNQQIDIDNLKKAVRKPVNRVII